MLAGALLLAACYRNTVPPASPSPRPAPRVAPSNLPAVPAHVGPRSKAVSDAELEALWGRQLMVPVDGIARRSLHSDYSAKRGDGIHGALDILAPRSTAVLAADDCIIGRLSSGPVGGIIIYASDPTLQFVYYYAHLEGYRRGLGVGDRVAKGSVIGYVGTTGNAPPDTPHLHFQVMKRSAGPVWWTGPAINPISFFAFDGRRP